MLCKNGHTDCLDTTNAAHDCPLLARAPRRPTPPPVRCAGCGWRHARTGWLCSTCEAPTPDERRALGGVA